jgi:integrase
MERRTFTINLYTRARSPFWYARVFVEGELGEDRPGRRFSTGVVIGDRPRVSKRAAQKEAERRATLFVHAAVVDAIAASSTSLRAVSERMVDQKVADKRRDRAVDALVFNLDKHVLPYFGDGRDVTTIRRRDLEAFKVHLSTVDRGGRRGYEPTTINNALTAIRQTLKYASEVEELLDAMPVVKNVAVDKQGKGRALTPAQVDALLAAVDGETREFLLFLANTGLRKTEALAVRWDWIDWRAREIRIPAHVRKGGKPQLAPTPINRVVMRLLRARRRRAEQPSLERVFWQLKHDRARNDGAARAGVGRVRNHDLRHTLGSLAHARGAAATEVRDLLGHSTMAMVSRYGHSYQARLRAVAERVQLGGRVCRVSVPGERRSRGAVSARSGKAAKSRIRRKRGKIKQL